ncbi:MAG: cytidylate kinase-like family protein [Lachnospiraceae bacterium]|jgi:cytidylate kinase|nr:cytidylate kinase-like family protein [Lachnospiraceae bacterium]MDD3614756.1 cytidylate kinase-like family protein [Lachnospiraceae bacterium]
MNNYVITIARGFGTGGKEIASALAKELGIECYENRILTLASEYSGYDEKKFVAVDERLRGGILRKMTKTHHARPQNGFVSDEQLFEYQAEIIKDLARTESCIIVGKCADYVLKEFDNVVSVYIEAPRHYCVKRIQRKMQVTATEANNLIESTDKYRAEYYKYYTGGNYWTNPVNYDITVNVERIGQELCKRLVKDCLTEKLGVVIK